MDVLPEDVIEDFKEKFGKSSALMTNNFALALLEIRDNTKEFLNVQMESVNKLVNDVEKGITASEEFSMHCDVMLEEFEGVEELARRVKEIRKNCEEMERRVNRVKAKLG